MSGALDALLQHPGIWRGSEPAKVAVASVPTGHAALDALLPGGGWPVGALTEILAEQEGIGELRLLMPALARLSQEGRWLAWIAPRHIPYAPALASCGIKLARVVLVRPQAPADALWATEQALRAGCCGAVLAWPSAIDERALRRLQLAAEAGAALGLLFRPARAAADASPAALRLSLAAANGKTRVRILKRRGGGAAAPVLLDLAAA